MQTSCVVVLVAGFVGQPADVPPFVKQYSKPTTFYYKSPDPRLGPKLLKELLKKENLEHPFFAMRGHVLVLLSALLGDIATGKPEIVRAYEAAFNDAAVAGRRIIIRSLMNCGDRQTIKQVEAWLDDRRHADLQPELKALKKHLQDPARKHARARRARTPDDLDLLWVNFFVTGEYPPVARILDVLDLPAAKENEILKRVARWSLASNMEQHPKLVELVRKHVKERPKMSRKVVEELLVTFPKEDKK
jgi:hypothetical protein